ncbi:hypothetical protein [Kitasatospora camelliae]|uniref:Uncharacterized protein n=1 Tax=Kitasatospora camelliae TaxID=3156397 RepID=A0AAU8K4H7_9ACTN
MTADRMVVALVLAGIAGGAVAGAYGLYGIIDRVLNLMGAWCRR